MAFSYIINTVIQIDYKIEKYFSVHIRLELTRIKETCLRQGCQMVPKSQFGYILRVLEWKMLVYFIVIRDILWEIGIFYS
jgi:hypothetical protein